MIKYEQIKHIVDLPIMDDYEIHGIVDHHAYVQKGYLYIARKGNHYNPFETTLPKQCLVLHEQKDITDGVYVENMMEKVKRILDVYYRNINDGLCLVGVCGTNGKSSVVTLLYHCLKEEAMCITSDCIQYAKTQLENENTTPNEILLLHLLDLAKREGCKYVIMEVSSQGIDLGRVARLYFDYIVYTSISQDHLDHHKTLVHYRYTKYKLVKQLKPNGTVLACVDELYYQQLKVLHKEIYTYGFQSSHFQINDMKIHEYGSTFMINNYTFQTHLVGKENVLNCTACIGVLRFLQISYENIQTKLTLLRNIQGRMELVYDQSFQIYIDYAHTRDAFAKSLYYLQSIKKNRVIVVVGCGGQREVQKRAQIGSLASHYSDICIFSEDNTRNESLDAILQDMCKKVQKPVVIIKNREEAIRYAITNAQKNDIILLSGKGNETYLLRNNEKVPFFEKKIIKKIVGS